MGNKNEEDSGGRRWTTALLTQLLASSIVPLAAGGLNLVLLIKRLQWDVDQLKTAVYGASCPAFGGKLQLSASAPPPSNIPLPGPLSQWWMPITLIFIGAIGLAAWFILHREQKLRRELQALRGAQASGLARKRSGNERDKSILKEG